MKQQVGTKKQQIAAQQAQSKRRKRKRKGRNLLYYLMFAFIAVSVGIILSLTVFFKIELIEVHGTEKYQVSAVISSSGIMIGDNTFRVQDSAVKAALMGQYPYIEDVKIRRHLPTKLSIEISEAKPLGAFLTDTGYILVSDTGRVLEVGSGACPKEYFQVSGVDVGTISPCMYLNQTKQEEFNMLQYLTEAVEKTGFDKITKIDLSNRLNMVLIYDDRLQIELGVEGELEDKLDFAHYAIENTIRPDFEGIIDVTIPKQVRTIPAEIHPEGYHGDVPAAPSGTETTDEVPTEGEGSSSSEASSTSSKK